MELEDMAVGTYLFKPDNGLIPALAKGNRNSEKSVAFFTCTVKFHYREDFQKLKKYLAKGNDWLVTQVLFCRTYVEPVCVYVCMCVCMYVCVCVCVYVCVYAHPHNTH